MVKFVKFKNFKHMIQQYEHWTRRFINMLWLVCFIIAWLPCQDNLKHLSKHFLHTITCVNMKTCWNYALRILFPSIEHFKKLYLQVIIQWPKIYNKSLYCALTIRTDKTQISPSSIEHFLLHWQLYYSKYEMIKLPQKNNYLICRVFNA